MKIKVIDLLNKIANGEEVPEKIKYEKDIFKYVKHWEQYVKEDTEKPLLKIISEYNYSGLYDTVETIEEDEENEDINIQRINQLDNIIDYEEINAVRIIDENRNKINELIRAIKQIDKKLKGE